MSQDRLLTTADLARRWRTTEQAVYGARYRGNCPNAIRIGKRLLWRLADVEAWEQERLGDDVQRRHSTVGAPLLAGGLRRGRMKASAERS